MVLKAMNALPSGKFAAPPRLQPVHSRQKQRCQKTQWPIPRYRLHRPCRLLVRHEGGYNRQDVARNQWQLRQELVGCYALAQSHREDLSTAGHRLPQWRPSQIDTEYQMVADGQCGRSPESDHVCANEGECIGRRWCLYCPMHRHQRSSLSSTTYQEVCAKIIPPGGTWKDVMHRKVGSSAPGQMSYIASVDEVPEQFLVDISVMDDLLSKREENEL